MTLIGFTSCARDLYHFWSLQPPLLPGSFTHSIPHYLRRRCRRGSGFIFAADGAAYQAAVINHYRRPGRSFSITAHQDAAVKREIQNLPETAWRPYRTQDDIAKDRQIAETVHSMEGTEQAFRLIVLRWPNRQPSLFEADRYCYNAVATNREESASAVIWQHNDTTGEASVRTSTRN